MMTIIFFSQVNAPLMVKKEPRMHPTLNELFSSEFIGLSWLRVWRSSWVGEHAVSLSKGARRFT
ncbi:hypothetical protein DNTS_033560 [Danionella cerebrum]|uniref:Uncharacterized protein n=1 Tax=Danionella cerebrum TaxID=2873325 RepID=A0A553N1M5_9TELE|nr:hypothetical protein DNTS_033560 [Danionella translucida]